jgi:hypothetical protein
MTGEEIAQAEGTQQQQLPNQQHSGAPFAIRMTEEKSFIIETAARIQPKKSPPPKGSGLSASGTVISS